MIKTLNLIDESVRNTKHPFPQAGSRRGNREGVDKLIHPESRVFCGCHGPALWPPVQIVADFQNQTVNLSSSHGVIHLSLFPVTNENAGIGQGAKMTRCV
jgi:hypothetical protein